MHAVYVGDARDVVERVSQNHCVGNVEVSALRKYVAEALGFRDPKKGEAAVSEYIHGGWWLFIVLPSYEDAHDFQWYVIEKLDPILNRTPKPYARARVKVYEDWLSKLEESRPWICQDIGDAESGSGVYVLYHDSEPSEL